MKKNEIIKKSQYLKRIRTFERKYDVISALILAAAIIIFWRGIWELGDLYLFPDNPTLSAVASIIIGALILYLRDFDLKELLQ
jgi:uncharacterized membrane-anchored protein